MTERERALQLLRRIESEQLYASLVLLHEPGFVRTLVLGVLRWRSRLDHAIHQFAKRQVEADVLDVLRVGAYQLLYMDVAKYAAVGETVSLAPLRARGFVNAILRRIGDAPPLPPKDLATRTAHPRWLIDRWTRMYGAERTVKIAEADQEFSYPDVLALTNEVPAGGARSTLVDGLWRLSESTAQLDRAKFHPMDEGSAVIAAMARACGDEILDLAAAPGGKTIYMRHRGARVVSADISLSRLRPLLGREARLVVADGRQAPFARRFPVVLLDAPCSATGTIRKNPEIKWRLRESDLAAFATLQRELLVAALELAEETVVYSTCSLEPEENDEVVALARDRGFAIADAAQYAPAGATSWVEDRVLRLTSESGADGFTAFVLRRGGMN